MELHDITTVSDEILMKLTTVMNSDCQPGKYSLVEIRDKYVAAGGMDIFYMKDGAVHSQCMLLDIYPKHKSVYIHDVCVAKTHRGQGLFKKAVEFLAKHYAKRGFKKLTLDASDSTKEAGLDQKARVAIFSKAGFKVSPMTDTWDSKGEYKSVPTRVLLDSGSIGNANSPIGEIKRCYGLDDEFISCPMSMDISKKSGGKKRKTRRTVKRR
jgi:GNAT superfamily N-acetyltransferase